MPGKSGKLYLHNTAYRTIHEMQYFSTNQERNKKQMQILYNLNNAKALCHESIKNDTLIDGVVHRHFCSMFFLCFF